LGDYSIFHQPGADGRICAAAYKGISVLGAADLSSRMVWETATEFDSWLSRPTASGCTR
jgi:hypothetical protein